MTARKKIVFSVLLGMVLLILATPVLLLALISAEDALVGSSIVDARSGQRAKFLIGQIQQGMRSQRPQTTLYVREYDLNSLHAFISRAIPRLRARSSLSSQSITNVISIHTPKNPFGQYINLHFDLLPSDQGLRVSQMKVGSLALPGAAALWFARQFMNTLYQDKLGDVVLGSISKLKTRDRAAIIYYKPIPDINQRLASFVNQFSQGALEYDKAPFVNAADVNAYGELLCQLSRQDQQKHLGLSDYIEGLFAKAKQRSVQTDVITENRNVIYTMAIMFGSHRFAFFVNGQVRSDILRCGARLRHVTLSSRRDLLLHFVYSAGLRILSDNQISDMIGELKELSDTHRSGSGFSFSDLAADLAGTRFAEYLTGNPVNAKQAQTILARNGSENIFFPSLQGLADNLTEEQFRQRYVNANSEAYQRELHLLRVKINRLNLYQSK